MPFGFYFVAVACWFLPTGKNYKATAQRSIATQGCDQRSLPKGKNWAACTTSLCEAVIFDHSLYRVGNYVTQGQNKKIAAVCKVVWTAKIRT